MNSSIEGDALRRGVTRLCHFTPSRNVAHILSGNSGLLASKYLKDDEREVFNPTDLHRFDGFDDHVCCSIEYPNGWYFRKARACGGLFRDWVVLLIKPDWLWHDNTKFSQRNAAAGRGAGVEQGFEAYRRLFAPSVTGAYDNTYTRDLLHPDWLPTDEQAEILIGSAISLEDVTGIAVANEAQAKREFARFRILQREHPRIMVVPAMFDAYGLSAAIRRGIRPVETEYNGDT